MCHPVFGFLAGGGAMLAFPLGVPLLMPSMASTLRAPVRGVSPPPREGAMDRAPFSTVAYPLAGSLDCPGFTFPLSTCKHWDGTDAVGFRLLRVRCAPLLLAAAHASQGSFSSRKWTCSHVKAIPGHPAPGAQASLLLFVHASRCTDITRATGTPAYRSGSWGSGMLSFRWGIALC